MSTFDTDIKLVADKTDQYLKSYFSQQKQNNELFEEKTSFHPTPAFLL